MEIIKSEESICDSIEIKKEVITMRKRISNIELEEMLLKQFLTKSDIHKIMGMPKWAKVSKAFDDARKLATNKGLCNYYDDKVHVTLVFELLGYEEARVHRYAKMERQIKRDTAAVESTVSQS